SVLAMRQRGSSSFTAMDILLLFLADHQRFPSLRQIVIVGHGEGGDFVQRYAALGQGPDVLEKEKLPVRFVVANPSSYLYLTHVRPADTGRRFINPDFASCPKMDDYPYGIKKLPAYAKRIGGNAVRMRYPQRDVVYLVGDKIVSDNFINRSCEALAQGPNRTSRTQSFGAYISQSFGEAAERTHQFVTVRGAGYDPVALYGSSCGMTSLFGDGRCQKKDEMR
ncbi:MAG: alpha/beta hydrolase, partial [Alphaproteobacteria bacterium]|nr:alpha/beta hydrolase [Alphaproteobacteria bacterium]